MRQYNAGSPSVFVSCITIGLAYDTYKISEPAIFKRVCYKIGWHNTRDNSLIPWSRVLSEKLTCPQLLNKLPAFYETQRFITAFAGAPPSTCPYPEPDRPSPCPPIHPPEDPFISPSHLLLGLSSGRLLSGSPTKNLNAILLSLTRATCPAHFSLLDLIIHRIFGEEYKP
jgi:hypothetical protein